MLAWEEIRRRRGVAAFVTALAALAAVAPLRPAVTPESSVGLLLGLGAVLEWLHGQRRPTLRERMAAWREGAVTLLMAALLLLSPLLSGGALVVFLAAQFLWEGARRLSHAWARPDPALRRRRLTIGGLDILAGLGMLLLLRANAAITWTVAIAAALRLLEVARRIATARVVTAEVAGDSLIEDLQLMDVPGARATGDQLEVEAALRAPIDRGWVMAFLVTLFAIHAGRMGGDWSLAGLTGPAAAVLGDVIVAILFTMGAMLPVHLLVQRISQPLERRAWRWWARTSPTTRIARVAHRGVHALLLSRLRSEMQWQVARLSIPGALGRSVRLGLPVAAVVAATVPVWGMSWYFDTENWAAGIYNSWAETRTDDWRAAMVRAIRAQEAREGRAATDFSVSPPGVSAEAPFSFIVIGDTGEGDASQHVLRDQLLAVAARDDVRFVVVSSDVVYPTGAMRDYEHKFWLPFKGVTRPVYAIPGNHDWYDALEGFNATFLTPRAARAAIGARVNADLNISTTTAERIDHLVAEAARLRGEYGVPTGFQRAPFFDLQTDRFALLAIDTGIVKRVDAEQLQWLDAALARARGKLILAVLGHPFYAGGIDQRPGHEDFQRLYDRLKAAGVAVVMAGDTHDLEHYVEPADATGQAMQHVVNGGGGAYLSFGTALAWPADPAVPVWAYYPSTAAVVGKIETYTPWWKRPAWWWTRSVDAWPFSAEWLSAVFDYNTAPFFQSFVEVRVEPDRLVLRPYGVHGRLRWRDVDRSDGHGAGPDDLVEWTVVR
jgi:3',5'-cyclic AMP phosphodiesterase CpdA